MQAGNDSTRLSDLIPNSTPLLRFHTNRRNFHAFLSSIGRCFDGTVPVNGTSEIGLALLFILLNDGEVTLLAEGRVHYC
ncbi:MAG TPA: hypothetical protein VGK24_00055 [Candidatus Angelobacter sp.]|jgi:hypothetical protein